MPESIQIVVAALVPLVALAIALLAGRARPEPAARAASSDAEAAGDIDAS